MSEIKKYCEGLDCTWCDEKEPCIYKTANGLQAELTAKEQECEKLKEEKQGLIKDWEEKKNLAYEIACKNEKLKQALKEIKEIAEEDCKQCFEIDGFSKPDDCGICPYNKILEKISEVIDEN